MINMPENRKAYVATVKVMVKAEACENQAGACDWFSGLLSENPDVVDWGYVDNKTHPKQVQVPKDYEEGDLMVSPGSKSKPLRLNERELATVLAALRTFQKEDENYRGSMTHFTDVKALNDEEIDDLCVRLNMGE